jgi:glucuronate isomerase
MPDAGFDAIEPEIDYGSLVTLLNGLDIDERPDIVLYSLNPADTAILSNISGAFRNVYVGAAWWFNDTLEGIRSHLKTVAE